MKQSEILKEFIESLRYSANYWSQQKDISEKERCDKLAFSFLTLLDGISSESVLDPIELSIGGECFNNDILLHDLYYETK